MEITLLKKLGFEDKEIKVYLALLENGSISVRTLADLTGVNRGTVYDILKNMQEKGLVSYYHADTKQKFVAEDPDKLLDLARAAMDETVKTKSELESMIPELKSLQDKGSDKPASKFYEGRKGIRMILADVLETMAAAGKDKEYYVYSAKKASEDLKEAFPDFTKKRIKAGVSVKVISLAGGGNLAGLDERKWLGTNHESATFIIIYNGKCAYIDRDNRNNPIGVIIENKSIYETNKLIFRQLWGMIK